VAFSPGLATAFDRHGRPKIWISHGRSDPVLPIDRTSRRIVPALEEAGYEVIYREFDGVHTVPTEMAREAIRWLSNP
jgi:phospholipase/carboxylesterase